MPRSPQWMDLYQIWFRGGGPLADVINRAEFCCSRLMGFESVRGQNSLLGDVLVGNHPFVIFAVLDVSFAVVSKPQFFLHLSRLTTQAITRAFGIILPLM